MPDLNDLPRTYSPPPVSADEAEPAFSHPSGGAPWEDVARWRKAERARLIDERMQMSADKRLAGSERIARKLDRAIGKAGNRIVSLYWPFKGEPDLRHWLITVLERGARIALPVVVEKKAPLVSLGS